MKTVEVAMTRSQMICLVTGNLTEDPIGYHDLWRKCGSPQHPDNALFDEVLVALSTEGIIARRPVVDALGYEVWGVSGKMNVKGEDGLVHHVFEVRGDVADT